MCKNDPTAPTAQAVPSNWANSSRAIIDHAGSAALVGVPNRGLARYSDAGARQAGAWRPCERKVRTWQRSRFGSSPPARLDLEGRVRRHTYHQIADQVIAQLGFADHGQYARAVLRGVVCLLRGVTVLSTACRYRHCSATTSSLAMPRPSVRSSAVWIEPFRPFRFEPVARFRA